MTLVARTLQLVVRARRVLPDAFMRLWMPPGDIACRMNEMPARSHARPGSRRVAATSSQEGGPRAHHIAVSDLPAGADRCVRCHPRRRRARGSERGRRAASRRLLGAYGRDRRAPRRGQCVHDGRIAHAPERIVEHHRERHPDRLQLGRLRALPPRQQRCHPRRRVDHLPRGHRRRCVERGRGEDDHPGQHLVGLRPRPCRDRRRTVLRRPGRDPDGGRGRRQHQRPDEPRPRRRRSCSSAAPPRCRSGRSRAPS